MTQDPPVKTLTCWEYFYIFCCPPFPRRITEKIAFQPPKPPNYDLVATDSHVLPYAFHMSPIVNSTGLQLVQAQDSRFVKTSLGNNIAVLHVKTTSKKAFTIIFSHGNAVDLGQVHKWCADISLLTGCDVVSYDYSGYGQSEGRPTEKNMYADIRAAWDYTISLHEPDPKKIVLFGRSLGCVPTVDLATKVTCAGVVIQSGFTSAYRFFFPSKKDPKTCFNSMKCIDKIPKVKCPVLIIHGAEDDVIDFCHGPAIYESCSRAVEPLWVEGAGHNNIEQFKEYKERLRRFISEELAEENSDIETDDA